AFRHRRRTRISRKATGGVARASALVVLRVGARPWSSRYNPGPLRNPSPHAPLQAFRAARPRRLATVARQARTPRFRVRRSNSGAYRMTAVASLRAIAIGVPWSAAILTAVIRRKLRGIALAAALVALIAGALLLRAAPVSHSLQEALMVLYSCLTASAVL